MDIPVISIIDDDELVRDAVQGLVRSLGYVAAGHASAEEYLRSNEHGTASCLITDIQMPGMSGVDLQAKLIAEGNFTPIIFMTAFDNENIRARVLKAGAFGYLKKPFDEQVLVRYLEEALKTRGNCQLHCFRVLWLSAKASRSARRSRSNSSRRFGLDSKRRDRRVGWYASFVLEYRREYYDCFLGLGNP